MRRIGWISSVCMSLAAAGCLGGYQGGTPGTPGTPASPGTAPTPGMTQATARQQFDTNVWPTLQANCATCHVTGLQGAPIFLASDDAGSYAKLTADSRMVNNSPPNSELITQGKHEGPALTPDQAAAIQTWLTMENTERGNLPAAPPPANLTQRALTTFGACMSLTDWNSTGMNDIQNQDTAGNAGQCSSCHETGMYVYLSGNATNNFTHMYQMPWLMKFAIASTNADGSFADIVPAWRIRDRGQEAGHPAYTLTTARLTALTNMFNLTYTKYKAGNCTPPAAAPSDMGPPSDM
jgi:mono/diheme cytochrome c family protein